jgi:hypothetical protein
LPFEALSAQWRTALDAAQAALRTAALSLDAQEVGERGRQLADERSYTAQLLETLARELRVPRLDGSV